MGGCAVVIFVLLLISLLPLIIEGVVWLVGIALAVGVLYWLSEKFKSSSDLTKSLIKRYAYAATIILFLGALVYGLINEKTTKDNTDIKQTINTKKQETNSTNSNPKPSSTYSSNSTKLSSSEVFYWIQGRYQKYEELYDNGEYTGDKYTTEVFLDAADYFGTSVTEVRKAYDSFTY